MKLYRDKMVIVCIRMIKIKKFIFSSSLYVFSKYGGFYKTSFCSEVSLHSSSLVQRKRSPVTKCVLQLPQALLGIRRFFFWPFAAPWHDCFNWGTEIIVCAGFFRAVQRNRLSCHCPFVVVDIASGRANTWHQCFPHDSWSSTIPSSC